MDAPDKLQHVLDRLPHQRRALRERMLRDPSFRAICADYGAAVEALSGWESSSEPEASLRAQEFRELVTELQAEILAALDEN